MYTVYLINSTLIVVSPSGGMMGEVVRSRAVAVDMYMDVAAQLDAQHVLSNDSCIIN